MKCDKKTTGCSETRLKENCINLLQPIMFYNVLALDSEQRFNILCNS